jgi:hypothetical protein
MELASNLVSSNLIVKGSIGILISARVKKEKHQSQTDPLTFFGTDLDVSFSEIANFESV